MKLLNVVIFIWVKLCIYTRPQCLNKSFKDINPTLEISPDGWTKMRQLRLWLERVSSCISILNINECLIWGGERGWPFLPHYTSDESSTHTHTQNNRNEETPSRDTQTKSCNGLLPCQFQNKLNTCDTQCFQPLEHMNSISRAALSVTSPALHHFSWEKRLSNTLTRT